MINHKLNYLNIQKLILYDININIMNNYNINTLYAIIFKMNSIMIKIFFNKDINVLIKNQFKYITRFYLKFITFLFQNFIFLISISKQLKIFKR